MVVVDHDKPNGIVLWSNEHARSFRILPGLRFATGLSLCSDLRAGVVESTLIDSAVEEVERELQYFSPGIEPIPDEPGVFWVDASGLRYLYPSLEQWAQAIRRQVFTTLQLKALVAVGFSRFGSYALARSMRITQSHPSKQRAYWVLPNAREELKRTSLVPLNRLNISVKLRDALCKLGIHTVGDFVKLPASGLKERFGRDAFEFHRRVSGLGWQPLNAHNLEEPVQDHLYLDHSETDTDRLLFVVRRISIKLIRSMRDRYQLANQVEIRLRLDTRRDQIETLKTTKPTLDLIQWTELIRLRFETLNLNAGIREVHVRMSGVTADDEQLRVFRENPKRDTEAATRALDRLKAEFGEGTVVKAELREGHLPEASFRWLPLEKICLPSPKPGPAEERPLVRRILPKPTPLPYRQRHERNDGWLVKGVAAGPAIDTQGPLKVSGGWWVREVRRDYYFVQLQNDELLWIFFDRHRRKWFLHGEIA